MPDPQAGETQQEFMSRCIPMVLEDGTAENQGQAVAICEAKWSSKAAKAVMKKEADGEHPASHYLVVEDPQQVTTWHLLVKDTDGTPNHRYMGAAWAALHGGYRGNRYEGPNKQEAIRKLTQMYASEDMPTPGGGKAAVKAVGDWELEVLGVPYGGPNDGKDLDGEYFSERTNLHLDELNPLILYLHGYDGDVVQNDPQPIGKAISYEKRKDGVWFRVALDKANEYAKRVWDAAKSGLARASSDSLSHLVRKAKDGEILNWPLAGISLFDGPASGWEPRNAYAVALPVMKAIYQRAGVNLPELREEIDMDEKEITAAIDERVNALIEQREAAAKAEIERKQQFEEAVKAEAEKRTAEALKAANRLPTGEFKAQVPNINLDGDIDKFDNLAPGEHAFMISAYQAMKGHRNAPNLSDAAIKALVMKMDSEETRKTRGARDAMKALRAHVGPEAVKAYEINYSTYASYGDDWVGIMYHTDLWEKIRAMTWVFQELERGGDVREVPQGFESDLVPLESTDPVWYKVPQATAYNSTTGRPDATITSSNIGTANKAVTLAKMGCRVIYTGEMVEDSLINWVPNAYRQIQVSGAEQMEFALIDGDTSSANTTNINDIGGQPAGTEIFCLVDGFRKLALVTNTANSRDGGTLTVEDYLETAKLMGRAGLNAANKNMVAFIVDPWVAWKNLELDEVKTKDTFSQPTLENGELTGLYGYRIRPSYFMQYAGVHMGTVTTASYQNKSNSAGKVDQDTEANNTKGAILAVRWDQWALRWKRRMSLESQRWPEADASQIVALMRWGLGYRDTEASAITYNLTV